MSSAEEIEVNVRQIEEPAPPPEQPMMVFDVMRKLLLAGVGAVALTRDEVEAFLNRLVERGEIAQKDAQRLLEETMSKFRNVGQSRVAQAESQVSSISVQVENNLEQFLNRLNIPSKRDIDELSAKIAELAARVEELRLVQEQSSRGAARKNAEVKAEG
jgi:poly(hydroxyalkanoate) granule-associated protein